MYCALYCVLLHYNSAQQHEQFYQVGWLIRLLWSLSVRVCHPSASATFCIYGTWDSDFFFTANFLHLFRRQFSSDRSFISQQTYLSFVARMSLVGLCSLYKLSPKWAGVCQVGCQTRSLTHSLCSLYCVVVHTKCLYLVLATEGPNKPVRCRQTMYDSGVLCYNDDADDN